jgi:hypothetical protein
MGIPFLLNCQRRQTRRAFASRSSGWFRFGGVFFLLFVVIGDLGVEVGLFMRSEFQVLLFEKLGRFGDEDFGPLFIFIIGLRKSPVGHGAVGVVCEDVAEGPLGFVIPKAMKLPKSLVEVGLSFFP